MKRLANGHYQDINTGTEYMSVWTYNRVNKTKLVAIEVSQQAPTFITIPTETKTKYETVKAYTLGTLDRIAKGHSYEY